MNGEARGSWHCDIFRPSLCTCLCCFVGCAPSQISFATSRLSFVVLLGGADVNNVLWRRLATRTVELNRRSSRNYKHVGRKLRVSTVTCRDLALYVSRLCTTFRVPFVGALQLKHDALSVHALSRLARCHLFYLFYCHSNCSHKGWPNVDWKLLLCPAMLAL